MRKILLTFLLIAGNLCLCAQKIDWTSFFANDIDTLSISDENALKIWAASHYHFRHEVLEIRGHADQNAENEYNEKLSMRRAKHIEAVLREQGFDNVRLTYYGESLPICDSKEEWCLSRNRRVEVLLYEDREERWLSNAQLPRPQVLFANTEKKLTIEGKGGTKVHFSLGSLFAPNGYPYFGPIRIEMREVLNPLDCIKGGISTVADGQLIETGGMAEIRVFRLFDNAELAIDKFIEVQFPSQNKLLQNGMQTFLPIIKGTQMAWKAIEWEVEPYDLKWFQERRKGKAPESAWYPTGTGAPGTTDDIKGEFFYTCDTVMLSAEQINAKKARVSQGIAIPNSIKMTDFGWINCDRFLRSTDLVEVKIVANDPQVFTYVLFNKRRVATACYTGGSVWIPNNELITIVCMDYSEDGIVTRFAMKKVTAARGQVEMEVESLPNEVMIQHETLLRSLWS